MIIISQDKTKIINFKNVSEIWIAGKEIDITDNIYTGIGETIGNYVTEERAKEVFKEIVKCYSCSEQLKCVVHINGCLNATELNNLAATSFIYEMPEE